MTQLAIHRTDHSHADASLYPPVTGTAQRVRSYDGTELAVLVAGDGPSLVLAHGSLVSSASWALMWRPLLDAGYRLIAYDLRGHGLSTLGADGFGAAPYGHDLAAVLDNFDVRDSVVVAHSAAGIVRADSGRPQFGCLTTRVDLDPALREDHSLVVTSRWPGFSRRRTRTRLA
jgi:pimeloyl-ACP methyl ester carboxylesterase